jgi:hypothetical protein
MSNGMVMTTALGLLLTWPLIGAQAANAPPHRLRTQFTRAGKCLDIVNDGNNNTLTMAACGNFSGQMWTIKPTGTPGYSLLRTKFTGAGKCLDIVNDGNNNMLTMAACGNFSGQMWTIKPTGTPGYSWLRTKVHRGWQVPRHCQRWQQQYADHGSVWQFLRADVEYFY